MNDNAAIKLLKDELKKLVKNNTTVITNDSIYIVNIGDTEITVPRYNNNLVRKNILFNK